MPQDRAIVIAIDGPVGSGKSTLARRVAELMAYVYIDTGAMYRALALKALRGGLSFEREEDLETLARGTRIDLKAQDGTQQVFLDGEDVTAAIPEVAAAVRAAATQDCILDGEVIALKADGRPHPFQVTMRRLGRSRVRTILPRRPGARGVGRIRWS